MTRTGQLLVKLTWISGKIKKMQPENSCIFRTSGDEFVAFLPLTSSEVTGILIEKIQQEAALHVIEGVALSISFGYASVLYSDDSIVECMKISDNDMYLNKHRKKQNISPVPNQKQS